MPRHQEQSERRRVKVISFSGIDGAGKSTQINALQEWLREAQLRTTLLTFWDDVVVFSSFRESMSHKAFRGDKGVGSPERPLVRRDKNVTSTPVTLMRFFLYFADALSLRRTIHRLRKIDADVVIFDRYIYDELANLPLRSWLTRVFVRIVLRLVPKPDIAYLIDADPLSAFARKPEYPLEFVRSNREAYIALSRLTGASTIIEPRSVDAMQSKIREALIQHGFPSRKSLDTAPALS
jgi:thymidylate kinase